MTNIVQRSGAFAWQNRGRGSRLWAIGLIIVVLALLPYVLSSFHIFLATRFIILALLAMSLNLVFGFGGLPSLGHAAFFGIGGYTTAIGLTQLDFSFASVFLVALVLGAGIGALVGVLTIRTSGVYLLLLTLAFAQSLWALAFEQVQYTGGDNGIAGITRETIPFGFGADYYTFVLIIAVVLVGVMRLWTKSPAGRVLVAARESPSRVEALGYRMWPYRVGAFALSGTIAAIAGVLQVYLQGIASPELLGWTLSAEVLVMCILGGAATFMGPAVGALIVVLLQEVASSFTERWTLLLGVLYVLTMMFLPNGLLSVRFRRGKAGPAVAGPARDGTVNDEPPVGPTPINSVEGVSIRTEERR